MNLMNSQLADYDFTKLLEELGLTEKQTGVMYPSWWQIKEWLWQNYKITFVVKQAVGFKVFDCRVQEDYAREYVVETWKFESPILAEIDGIKKVVEHLHKKLPNKK